MDAHDLLAALNDIDPKLLEGAAPWGEAPQPLRRRPVWVAAAAALAVCVGLGFALPHLLGPAPVSQSAQEGAQLEYSSNPRSALQSLVSPDGSVRLELGQEEIAGIWGQEGLDWAGASPGEELEHSGTAILHQDGTPWMVSLTGKTAGGVEAFHMELSPGGLPPTSLEGTPPWNNRVEDTPVYAASYEDGGQRVFVAELVTQGESPVGLRATFTAQEGGLSPQGAQALLEALVAQCARGGVTLEGLSPAMPAFGEALPEDAASRALTQQELDALWGGEALALEGAEGFLLEGTLYTGREGELLQVEVEAFASQEAQSLGLEAFSLTLGPGAIPACEPRDMVAHLEAPSGQVEGVTYYAATGKGTRVAAAVDAHSDSQETLYESGTTLYNVAFLAGEVGVAAQAVCDPMGLEENTAQALLEALVAQCAQGGVTLEGLGAPASREDLSWATNTQPLFGEAYWAFQEQLLQSGGQGELSRELTTGEVADIWGGELPWEGEGSLAATALFSQEGELVRVTISPGAGEKDSFKLTLTPGSPPLSWPQYVTTSCLEGPNNLVNGREVWAAQYFEENRWGEGTESGVVWHDEGGAYNQYVYLQGEGYTLSGQASPGPWGFGSMEAAREFLRQVVEGTTQEGAALSHISALGAEPYQ